ncbi:MAG: aspartate aminotransferase family protein [Catenisphaera adipataccumulans]|uniref:aspartate aminotransferase family protein n=1 Tax=Catenisphaera adipataccumulans TaxID=700500 RepID=UPI003D90CDFC
MKNFKEIDDQYVAHSYARFPVLIQSGKGVYVYDDEGKKYIDFTSGIGVNSLGYQYEAWVQAVREQAGTIAHTSNLFYNEPMLELAEKLVTRTGMKKVFFGNSGAEANEAIIKAARKYANDHYHGRRTEICTLNNSFHGRTMETLSATGQEVFHQDFFPMPTGFQYADPNLEDVKAKTNEHTAAILLEMIQGEGGVVPLDPKFVQDVADLCKENDWLLMVDEVQTGIGRCGTFFAYEQFGIQPDLVSSAKGLGGGLPIGAALIGEKCEDVFQPGDHGSTFGGNPIVCAGANVVIDTLTPAFLDEVKEKGDYLKSELSKLPHVVQVDGLGMMLGVQFDEMKGIDVVNACLKKGALFLTAKDRLRLLPPLVMTKAEIDEGLNILKDVLSHWEEA